MTLLSATSNSDLYWNMKAFKTLRINRIMSESERTVVCLPYQRKPFQDRMLYHQSRRSRNLTQIRMSKWMRTKMGNKPCLTIHYFTMNITHFIIILLLPSHLSVSLYNPPVSLSLPPVDFSILVLFFPGVIAPVALPAHTRWSPLPVQTFPEYGECGGWRRSARLPPCQTPLT